MKSLITFLFCFHTFVIFPQDWSWAQCIGRGTQDEKATSIVSFKKNFYAAFADSVAKFDEYGDKKWAVRLPSGNNYIKLSGVHNGFIYAAHYNGFSKLDTSGNIIWTKSNSPMNKIEADQNNIVFGIDGNGIMRLDSSGSLIWQIPVAGLSDLFVQKDGSVIATGKITGTTTVIGQDTLTADGMSDILTLKSDSSGNVSWAKKAGGIYTGSSGAIGEKGYAIIADTTGNIYVTGAFIRDAQFGNLNVSGYQYNSDEIFIAKYDQNGNAKKVVTAGGVSDDEGRCICFDINGDIIIGGSYLDGANFSGNALPGWWHWDAYAARYDTALNFKSVIGAGGMEWNEFVYGVAVNENGVLMTCGTFWSDTTFFGTDTLFALGNSDPFIARADLLTTGIKNELIDAKQIHIFPNPAIDNITISKIESARELTITSSLGETVLAKKYMNGMADAETIDIKQVAPGIYFVFVRGESFTWAGKFIKE